MNLTQKQQLGSESLSLKNSSQQEMSIPEVSLMFVQMTFDPILSATSSLELEVGVSPCNSQDGPQINLCGQEVAPANPSPQQESNSETKTNDTSGPCSSILSRNADHQSYSENKSPVQPSSESDQKWTPCSKCGESKPSSDFCQEKDRRPRSYCKACKNKQNSRRRKENYSQDRIAKRGLILVGAARYRARKMGLPFDLEVTEIHRRIEAGVCELTGIPFDLVTPKAWNSPSLDQIKPSAGYTKDNVRVVLYSVNVMNHNWGPKYILEVADAIREQHKKKSNDLSERLAENLKKRLLSGSMEYKMTWKKLTTPSGLVLWQHQASAVRTSDSDCTGWPTPQVDNAKNSGMPETCRASSPFSQFHVTAQLAGWPTVSTEDHKTDGPKAMAKIYHAIETGTPMPTTCQRLRNIAALAGWTTPQAADHKGHFAGRYDQDGKIVPGRSQQLHDQVHLAGWPTPRASESSSESVESVTARRQRMREAGDTKTGNLLNLSQVATLAGWGTPSCQDARHATVSPAEMNRDPNNLRIQAHGATAPSPPAATENQGASQPKLSLNPFFSMWLMGFPVAWTFAGISSVPPKVSPLPKPSQAE
jgi:hypothetical protein